VRRRPALGEGSKVALAVRYSRGSRGRRRDISGIAVADYSTFYSSCARRAVSRSTRGFGPSFRGAKGRPSRRGQRRPVAPRLSRPAGSGPRGARVFAEHDPAATAWRGECPGGKQAKKPPIIG
jgi:hypothetical protein